jgi:hypothetical protein
MISAIVLTAFMVFTANGVILAYYRGFRDGRKVGHNEADIEKARVQKPSGPVAKPGSIAAALEQASQELTAAWYGRQP